MTPTWEPPSPQRPLLVALLVDVSASMLKSIDNKAGRSLSRLEGFRESLKGLARRARDLAADATGARVVPSIHVVAYGFGFGNPLRILFGRGGSAVRDLLDLGDGQPSLVPLDDLADRWETYSAHLEKLAVEMAGTTPMAGGFTTLATRLEQTLASGAYAGPPIVFVLSDGEPDEPPLQIESLAEAMKDTGALVISCYVTDTNIAETRRLYGRQQESWPKGARLMFDVASVLPDPSPFSSYLRELKWTVEANARLFSQVNQSEILSEFLNVVLSPAEDTSRKSSGRARSTAIATSSAPGGLRRAVRDRVFVSYAHADLRWLKLLQIHLRPLEREGRVFDLWADTRLQPGSDWRREIDDALTRCTVAILLISPAYLASDFIAVHELPQMLAAAEREDLLVLPVILSHSQFTETPGLSRFQAVNAPDRPLQQLAPHERDKILNGLAGTIRSRSGMQSH